MISFHASHLPSRFLSWRFPLAFSSGKRLFFHSYLPTSLANKELIAVIPRNLLSCILQTNHCMEYRVGHLAILVSKRATDADADKTEEDVNRRIRPWQLRIRWMAISHLITALWAYSARTAWWRVQRPDQPICARPPTSPQSVSLPAGSASSPIILPLAPARFCARVWSAELRRFGLTDRTKNMNSYERAC